MATIRPNGVNRFFDFNGRPLVGGLIETFDSGTSTHRPAYADAAQTTPLTNPIVLDASGRATIFWDGTYKVIVRDASGDTLETVDPLSDPGSGTQTLRQATEFMSTTQVADVLNGVGSMDVTGALNAFLAATDDGYLPAGRYKLSSALTFRSGQRIRGAGSGTVFVYSAVSPAANAPVLHMASLVDVEVSDLQLHVDPGTYPTARSLHILGGTNSHFRNIELVGGGGNAGYVESSTDCSISASVDDYRLNGFQVVGGERCVITARIPDGSGGMMGVQFVGGSSHVAKDCHIEKTPDNYFGIHSYGCSFAEIDNNLVKNTRREAIAIGGTTCFGVRVTNNTLHWDENLGIGDFGMSIAGNDAGNIIGDYLISGNTIVNAALDAIGVAGWCQRGIITANNIRDCAQAHASGFQAGIKIYGYVAGAVADDTLVDGNIFTNISGGMLYAVHESNELGVVNTTMVVNNKAFGFGGNDIYHVEASTSVIALNHDDLALKPFVPAVTAQTGTITTASATMDYQVIGRFVHCIISVTITTNGSGAGQVRVTLPFNPSGGGLTGFDAVGGKAIKAGPIGGNVLAITNYDNTYPGASGAVFLLDGILRIN